MKRYRHSPPPLRKPYSRLRLHILTMSLCRLRHLLLPGLRCRRCRQGLNLVKYKNHWYRLRPLQSLRHRADHYHRHFPLRPHRLHIH